MSRDDALTLDIVLAAADAQEFVQGMVRETFEASRLHQNAVIRSLEVIGEAAGKLSADFRAAHPEIPWRDIVNMRHRLIHAYSEIRLDVVWAAVEQDVPRLLAELGPLVSLKPQ